MDPTVVVPPVGLAASTATDNPVIVHKGGALEVCGLFGGEGGSVQGRWSRFGQTEWGAFKEVRGGPTWGTPKAGGVLLSKRAQELAASISNPDASPDAALGQQVLRHVWRASEAAAGCKQWHIVWGTRP